jgi:hypothetical protein
LANVATSACQQANIAARSRLLRPIAQCATPAAKQWKPFGAQAPDGKQRQWRWFAKRPPPSSIIAASDFTILLAVGLAGGV